MTSLLHRTIIAASLVSAVGALTLAPNLARANGAGTFAEVTSFGSNPGALKMYLYTPPGISDGAPIVVALHGCTSSATDYRKAGWEELADTYGFWVVYPGQTSSNNPAMCFNWAGDWGNFAGIERGKDENQSIVSMVRSVQADHHADAHRVYVSGHSAGAAMVMVLLATWPDVFDAGAAIAGVPYKCPSSYGDVFTCMTPGKDLDAATWGQRAASGYPGYSGPYPRLSSWHGTSDGIVSPNDQREIVDQWTALTGIDATPDVEDEVDGYPHAEYRDASGKTLVETYKITGAGHATFVDPDAGCGATGGYFADANICSSFHIARFFGLIGGDTGPTAEPDPGGDTAPGPGADTYTPPADTYTPPQNDTYTPPQNDTYTPPQADTYAPPGNGLGGDAAGGDAIAGVDAGADTHDCVIIQQAPDLGCAGGGGAGPGALAGALALLGLAALRRRRALARAAATESGVPGLVPY